MARDRAHMLVFGGCLTRSMMQSYASAAKLRGGGPILCGGIKAMPGYGAPPPRTVIGDLSQYADRAETVRSVPSAISLHCAGRRMTPSASRHRGQSARARSEACALGPQSFSCVSHGRSQFGPETA